MLNETLRFFTLNERPDLIVTVQQFCHVAWPEFMHHDPICNRLWPELYRGLLDYQFVLLESRTDSIAVAGNSIPISWDELPEHLPDEGLDWALQHGVSDLKKGLQPRNLCALQIVVAPEWRGKGTASLAVNTMKNIGRSHGLKSLLAPVRPNRKAQYPQIPMSDYVKWTDGGKLPFDPWIRVHIRLNAEIVRICTVSMTIPGTFADWERWSGMTFPETGTYIVEGALVPVKIDRESDTGLYVEPNVWMRHPLV